MPIISTIFASVSVADGPTFRASERGAFVPAYFSAEFCPICKTFKAAIYSTQSATFDAAELSAFRTTVNATLCPA